MNEHVRIVAAWCADAVNGVNARIAGLVKDAADVPPPALVQVLDDTTAGMVARRRIPKAFAVPALVIFDRGVRWPGGVQVAIRRGTTEVGLALIVEDDDTAAAVEDLNYLGRLVRQTLDALNEPAQVAARTRNQVLLEDLDGVEEVPVQPWFDGLRLVQELRTTWKVRDLAP